MTISPAHCTERFVQPMMCSEKGGNSLMLFCYFFLERGYTYAGSKCDNYMLGKPAGLKSEVRGGVESETTVCVHIVSTLHVTVNFGLVLNLMVVSVRCFNRVSHGLGVFGKY